MKTKFKRSEIELFIGTSIEKLFDDCDRNFDHQLETDLDEQLKSKLGIQSKDDPNVPYLKFAYKSGVLRGIMMQMIKQEVNEDKHTSSFGAIKK